MLEIFMKNNYRMKNYKYLNDRLQFIDYIDNKYEYQTTSVLPLDAYRFQGNLFGLFKTMNIEPKLYLYTMYINGYTNPINYDGKKYIFKVPKDPNLIEY